MANTAMTPFDHLGDFRHFKKGDTSFSCVIDSGTYKKIGQKLQEGKRDSLKFQVVKDCPKDVIAISNEAKSIDTTNRLLEAQFAKKDSIRVSDYNSLEKHLEHQETIATIEIALGSLGGLLLGFVLGSVIK